MAQSSDEIIKHEIIDTLGYKTGDIKLRIFPESSREDQKLFGEGGLTFGFKGVSYGSCDACWYSDNEWSDPYNDAVINTKPFIALEGTDALNRKSSGNAQYQRFHHALGAVKSGVIGVYYLKKGVDKIQPDLFGMAYYASEVESGEYLIVDDLSVVQNLLNFANDPECLSAYVSEYKQKMFNIFNEKFQSFYGGDWQAFAKKRSTIIKDEYIIKYAGRSRRNFTDGSQRAGHIAVGEMFLTKYYFYNKKFYYLFPKMTRSDLNDLDRSKDTDKEWFLLRNEENVEIKTSDDIEGLNEDIRDALISIKDEPLKDSALRTYNVCIKDIAEKLETGEYKIIP